MSQTAITVMCWTPNLLTYTCCMHCSLFLRMCETFLLIFFENNTFYLALGLSHNFSFHYVTWAMCLHTWFSILHRDFEFLIYIPTLNISPHSVLYSTSLFPGGHNSWVLIYLFCSGFRSTRLSLCIINMKSFHYYLLVKNIFLLFPFREDSSWREKQSRSWKFLSNS